jgi:hypothetical protein
LSKAASTAVDGAAAVLPRRDVCVGAGEAVASADFVAVFGMGVGFAVTVRVRLDGDVESCAKAAPAPTKIIEAMTTDLFSIFSSFRFATESQRERQITWTK